MPTWRKIQRKTVATFFPPAKRTRAIGKEVDMPDHPEPRWRILTCSNPEYFRKRAKTLLKQFRLGEAEATDLFSVFHPDTPTTNSAKLTDAQLVLARAHDYPSWPKFQRAIALFNAMLDDDPSAVMELIRQHPSLLHERVNGVTSNWGPPLACAAQIGSAGVFEALSKLPGQDVNWALDRAILKGRRDIAQRLVNAGVAPDPGAAMGPCESLNVAGLEFLADIGAPLTDEDGDRMAPVGMLLEGYFRDPAAKHACLKFFERQGFEFPDTPMTAFHFGRLDRLRKFAQTDSSLLRRRFSYRDIYPIELGCHEDETLGLHGTPLAGTTLLHMAIDFDEVSIAEWLLDADADVNAGALVDKDGFGNHTPLFNIVVSQAYLSGRQRDAALARTLIKHGADTTRRATVRKGIRFIEDESVHEYRDVTAAEYAQAFHARRWVSEEAIQAIRQSRQ